MTSRLFFWTALFSLASVVAVSAQASPAAETTQSAPTRSAAVQVPVENKMPGPDLPLRSLPTTVVSVRFVVDHRSALNGRTIRVRGTVAAVMLGDAACPPDRGLCMQPSVVLAESESGKSRPARSVRILMPKDSKLKDYPIGKAVELLAVVDGNKTAVVLAKVD